MCGITFAINKQSVNEDIINMYENQFKRGTKGFGMVYEKPDGSIGIKRSCEPYKAIIDLYSTDSKLILFHHRNPTSTDNMIEQTHPMHISNKELKYDYYVIHNGIIINEDEQKKTHKKLGYTYKTSIVERTKNYEYEEFNDSETLAIEVARYIEGKTNKINIEGKAAFIALQTNKYDPKKQDDIYINKIYFGRNKGNPLRLAVNRQYIRIASEHIGDIIKENTLYSFNPHADKYDINKQKLIFMKPKTIYKPKTTNKRPDYNMGFNFKTPKKSDNIDTTKKIDNNKKEDNKTLFTETTISTREYDIKNRGEFMTTEELRQELSQTKGDYYDEIEELIERVMNQNNNFTESIYEDQNIADNIGKLTNDFITYKETVLAFIDEKITQKYLPEKIKS